MSAASATDDNTMPLRRHERLDATTGLPSCLVRGNGDLTLETDGRTMARILSALTLF